MKWIRHESAFDFRALKLGKEIIAQQINKGGCARHIFGIVAGIILKRYTAVYWNIIVPAVQVIWFKFEHHISIAAMKIPVIKGIIERRILINFTADADIVKKIIPPPFSPKLCKGKAIVGICLIRLKKIRPKGMPEWISISSENGAHRIAVEWQEGNEKKEGVFVPRRDSSSLLNAIAGGRVFPGKHYHAVFDVKEENSNYQIAFKSSDDTSISINADLASDLAPHSIFETLENASAFFEAGAVGYSPNGNKYDGLELRTTDWKVQPLAVNEVHSSFFENEELFPKGSVKFDNALLMTEIAHEWHSAKEKYSS